MAGRDRRNRIVILAFLVATISSDAFADKIYLRGGGSIEGVVLPESDPDSPNLRIMTRSSDNPYVFERGQILRVEPVDDALRGYVERLQGEERTSAESEYQFGLWCVEAGLRGPARTHFERAVALDPSHAEAHKKLGHVELEGRWVGYDDVRRARGLVERDGRWVSKEEDALLEKRADFVAEQASWGRRLAILRRKWLAGDDATRVEAENQLAEIRDPAAVVPLLKTFGADSDSVRLRLATILAAIEGADATEALVRLVLQESDEFVRESTFAELASRHAPDLSTRFVKALKSKDQGVVGRAAWALAALDDQSSVPKLIPELLRVEQRMVLEPAPAPASGIGVGFSSYNSGAAVPGGSAGYAVPGGGGSVPLGLIGAGGSIPVLTGPVVGPGVVAYGATSVPYGAGTSLGYNGGANPNRPVSRVVTQYYPNEMVRDALRKLTGQDYAYDQDTWRRWVRSRYRANTAPARRVPQP